MEIIGFNRSVKEEVLVKCGRHCALCHKFCGTKIELHHIKQKADGGEDSFENCIPLCFDCHAEVKAYNPRHPKGTAYTESELIQHRNILYKRVNQTMDIINNKDYILLDREVYKDLKDMIYNTHAITFIRTHNFGEAFYNSELEPLYKFVQRCDHDPEFEFLDIDLESLRLIFLDALKKFLFAIGMNTFTLNNNVEINSVPKDWLLREDTAEIFNKCVDELNSLSIDITTKYDDMIKLARRKLS